MVGKDIVSNHGRFPLFHWFFKLFTCYTEEAVVSSASTELCTITVNSVKLGSVVPYTMAILYESGMCKLPILKEMNPNPFSVTLTLSLVQILSWRKRIPKDIRAPIINNLWRDGNLVFSTSLFHLTNGSSRCLAFFIHLRYISSQ